jgi:hypothetical protein
MLKDSVEIEAPPEKVFKWLTHFAENYTTWHPDHTACSWVAGEPMTKGSILCCEEYLHGELHTMKLCLTKIKPTKIEYKVLFPMSLICSKGSFLIESKGDHSIFTATLSFRFRALLPILFKERVASLKTHMKEEGENLKQLLESKPVTVH